MMLNLIIANRSTSSDLILASLTRNMFTRFNDLIISSYPCNCALVDPRPPFPTKGALNRMLLLAPIVPYALIEVSTD